MSKYIDADKLIHDLEERIYAYSEGYADGDDYRKHAIETLLKDVRYQCSLQQEQQEVDLEEITKFSRIKELPDGFDKDWLKYYHLDKEYNSVRFHHLSALEREYIIARHFYELGKNSK